MNGVLFSVFGFEFLLPVIALGTVIGLVYGLLAVGLVLVYRSNRIINFAHGEIGAFGGAIFGLLLTQFGVPYYLALPVAIGVAAGVGGLTEVVVVRRLRNAPRLMTIVATLGVGQFLLLFSTVVNSQANVGDFGGPPGLPIFDIGPLRITQPYAGMLLFSPLVVTALAVFLRRSRYGLAIRGAAANRDAARLAGIFANRMSSLTWAIAGALAGFTAILYIPARGFTAGSSFGPGLLLRALVAGVIGRMTNLPLALAGGVLVGIVEQELLWNYPQGGLVEAVLFVVILVALALQRRQGTREGEASGWAAVQAFAPIPAAFREVWLIRNAGRVLGGAGLVVAMLLPLWLSNSASVVVLNIMAFTIVGLSVGIITGLNGQLSLGQFALAGIGGVVSYYVSSRTGNFFLSFLYAGLAAAFASLAIGLPALRLRGLLLTVTTLSFALATPAWLLQQPWAFGEGLNPGRPIVGNVALESARSYHYVGLATLVVAVVFARNIWAGGVGRRLVAVRDNEDNARAFTISAAAVKVQAFMLAGFVAGLGGALYTHSLSRATTSSFLVGTSIDVVVLSVVGGIGILTGPLLGALFVIGVPAFLPLDSAGLAATSAGLLIIILYAPGGIAQIVSPIRERLLDLLARRAGLDVEQVRAAEDAVTSAADADDQPQVAVAALPTRERSAGPRTRSTVLEVVDLRRSFGGVKAVDGVSFSVRAGQTLGLIGPNGAGKTTLFELIGGFTRPDDGTVVFDGRDVTASSPEERARLGLIRSFQDAALFPTMTVLDAVRLSLEKVQPTPFLRSVIGVPGLDRERDERARDLVDYFGLDRYRTKQVQQLSTGTRRIVELACVTALEPTVLLLDEPSSGIAQRETESLGALLDDLKTKLGATLVVIEHDIPLIMSLADEIVAMDTGRVVAQGAPEHVRHHPAVVESYLGGDTTAIERSGTIDRGGGNGHPDRVPGSVGTLVKLSDIDGLGPARESALLTAFGSVEGVHAASEAQLAEIDGIGPALAERIRRSMHRG